MYMYRKGAKRILFWRLLNAQLWLFLFRQNKMVGSREKKAIIGLLGIILYVALKKKKANRKRRSTWVRPWLSWRETLGAFHALVQELRDEDPGALKNLPRERSLQDGSGGQLIGMSALQQHLANHPYPAHLQPPPYSQQHFPGGQQHVSSPGGTTRIPDIIFTGVDDHHSTESFSSLAAAVGAANGGAMLPSISDLEAGDVFAPDEVLRDSMEPLDMDSFHMLSEGGPLIADPAAEEALKQL